MRVFSLPNVDAAVQRPPIGSRFKIAVNDASSGRGCHRTRIREFDRIVIEVIVRNADRALLLAGSGAWRSRSLIGRDIQL